MKKFTLPFIALLFFAVSVVFIATGRQFRSFLPAQQVELSHGVKYGAVVKGFLFVQEITLEKRYLSRIDLYMAKLPRTYPNHNVFLLIDDKNQVLFTRPFSSDEFGEALYFPFDLKKSFDIGKGKTVYACVYSTDGDQGSYIGLAKKEESSLGKLYVVTIENDDVLASFVKKPGLVNFEGSIGARTFESDTPWFSSLQVLFYLVALLIAALIAGARWILPRMQRIRVIPERAFLAFALAGGGAMLVVTPPFMVPDEPAHFYRSWQVASMNIFKVKDEIPAGLTEFTSICNRMQFSTHEKTTATEILSLGKTRIDASQQTAVVTPDHIVPYLPQALGIGIGRIFGLSPLMLFYLGRLFNLLAAVLLIFIAIRTAPSFKWVFFLIGVMPMTLYQASSLSYDAVTTGLSFLLTAVILQMAFGPDKIFSRREIAVPLVIASLLAASKQPYAVIALAFFIIPRSRFGPIKRYVSVLIILAAVLVAASFFRIPGRALAVKLAERSAQHTPARNSVQYAALFSGFSDSGKSMLLALEPHGPSGQPGEGEPAAAKVSDTASKGTAASPAQAQPAPVSPVDPAGQQRFILSDPLRYAGILFNTLGESLTLYLTSFVGLFGWIDAPLPATVAYVYLIVILMFAFTARWPGLTLSFVQRLILAVVFITCYVLIETALYVYCDAVGAPTVTAVQGRYFIAIAPLMLLVFSNNLLTGRLNPARDRKPVKKVVKAKGPEVSSDSQSFILSGLAPWIAMAAAFIVLAISLFVLFERFYVLSS